MLLSQHLPTTCSTNYLHTKTCTESLLLEQIALLCFRKLLTLLYYFKHRTINTWHNQNKNPKRSLGDKTCMHIQTELCSVCERQAQYNIALIAQHLLLGKAVFLSSNAKRALNQKQIYILTTTLSLIFLFIQSKSFRSWLYKTERNWEKIIQPLTSLCSISLLCSSLSEYQTFCYDMTRLFSVSTHTRLSSLSTHANLTPIMIKRDKNMAQKHNLWRGICPVFFCRT